MENSTTSNGTAPQYDNVIIGNCIAASRGNITTFTPMIADGQIVHAIKQTPIKFLLAPREKAVFADQYLYVGADNVVYRKVYDLAAKGDGKFTFVPCSTMGPSKSGKTQELRINGLYAHIRVADLEVMAAGQKKAVMITARKDAVNRFLQPYTPQEESPATEE